jgi:hypothetical protein
MTQLKKPRRRQTDLQPNLGPGWIDDDRVPGSINRAVAAIADYIANLPSDKKPAQSFDEAVARTALQDPIRRYWADKDHDEREKFSDLKIQARQLKSKMVRFDKSIQQLPPPMKTALRLSFNRQYGEAALGEDRLAVIHQMNESVIRACDLLIKPKLEKPAAFGVVSLAAPLWNYWETMMSRSFARSWKQCKTRPSLQAKLGRNSFEHVDALFVQTIVKAIDSKAKFSDIRTRLKGVATQRRAAGKAPSVGAHRPRNASRSTTAGS